MASFRVLHLLKSLDIGGIETMALDFCNNAHREDMEVHLFCMGGGALQPEFEKSQACFHKRKKIPGPYDMIDPFLIRHLRKYIRQHGINVVHAHFADEGLHALAALRGLRDTVLVQGFAVDCRVNRSIDNRKFRFLARHADACVTLSHTLLQQLGVFGIRPKGYSGYVHNGIDPVRVTGGDPYLLKKELGLSPDTILGGMIGNFYNNVRDQATICRALALVIPETDNFHFVFAGGSTNQWIRKNQSYFQDCIAFCREKGIADRVHFPGLKKNLPDVFAGLDFYVHATNYDTFGMAPVEAMFNRLPVLVNDHPVFTETSRQGAGMLLFRDKEETDLAEQLTGILRDRESREASGNMQYEFAQQYFHIHTHIRNMKDFYQRCIEQKKYG